MGKSHVTAIIQALQETIENLSVNGCSVRSKISNPTVDSQYVQALEDDYGDEIDNIVDNIPDDPPAPTGPKVFEISPKAPKTSFATYDTVIDACDVDGNDIPYSQIENYVTGNNSMVCICYNSNTYGFVDTGVSVSTCLTNSSGNVAWKSKRYYQNNQCNFCAFISDTTGVTVVDIFESQIPYRCFKAFCYDGKYFVLDKTQKQWTDNLASLGYQLTPIDGVVYPFGAFCVINVSFSGGSSKYAKDINGQNIECNDALDYLDVGAYSLNGSTTDKFEFIRTNSSVFLKLTNNGSATNIFSAKYSTQSKMPNVIKLYRSQFGSTAQDTTIQPNSVSPWLYSSSSNKTNRNDYAGVTNAVIKLMDSSQITVARVGFSSVWDNTNGGATTSSNYYLSIRNDSSTAITCMYASVCMCQSNLIDVTVVSVYNLNNEAFNAFKYTSNGTNYYYVLDQIQTDWTGDLYSIRYAPTPYITPSIPNETRSFLRIKPVSGKIIYVGQQTRTNVSTSSNSIYDVFSDTDLTIPFDFDYKNKRYVFGYYGDAEQTRYLIYGVNTQDDFPEEAGIYTSYIYMPYAQSSIQCLKNSAQSSRSVSKSLAVQYRSYNDVIVLYFADSQLPTELHAGQEWDTRLKYDTKKTYKATMLINTYNGSKNQRNRIVDFSFINHYGRLFVKYNGTDYLYPYYECLVFYAANESYFTASGKSGTEDSTLTVGTSLNTLYDKDGQLIPYDSTKIYCIDKIATKDDGRSNANGLAPEIVSVTIDGSAYLALQLSETTDTVAAFVLEYTIATN